MIILQEDMVCFQIVEEAKTKTNNYGGARLVWVKLSREYEPTTGSSKIRLRNECFKYKLYDITRKPKECITDLELLIEDLQKLDVQINNS